MYIYISPLSPRPCLSPSCFTDGSGGGGCGGPLRFGRPPPQTAPGPTAAMAYGGSGRPPDGGHGHWQFIDMQ